VVTCASRLVLVLGLPFEVLLASALARLGVGRHVDAGAGAAYARLPAALGARGLAVGVELPRSLA
jgi:hypothetical protein